MLFCLPLCVLLWVSSCAGAYSIQQTGLAQDEVSKERASVVKQMFIESYDAYRRYAFGHDDLKPISRTYADSRNGWGATLVDSLDTMQIMGLRDFYDEAVQHISKTDFTKTRTEVNTFETFIRCALCTQLDRDPPSERTDIAGLLSAYELSNKRDDVLLRKAVELADKLISVAWEGSNIMPWTRIGFDGRAAIHDQVSVSSVSLIPEMRTLSKHTGNETYLGIAERIQTAVLAAPSPFAGLLPNAFWAPDGKVKNQWTTWGSGSDSAHEYLLKHHLLTNNSQHLYIWQQAVYSSIAHLTFKSTKGHVFLGEATGKKRVSNAAHLTTFAAGNWLLGAKVLDDEVIRKHGFELLDSAYATHDMSQHGFGPDEYTVREETAPDVVPRRYRRQAEERGFYCTRCSYMLRPETIESTFYAWRLTGDSKYQERQWRFVQDLKKLQVSSGGFAGIKNVFAATPRRIDHTESFFYAETLKYLYLTFAPLLSLDHFVFNTEAHPFKVDDAPEDAFALPTSLHVPRNSKKGARGTSLHLTFTLFGIALLVLLAHLVFRIRERRAKLPSMSRRRDGIFGTGGISQRSKSVARTSRWH